MQSSEIKPISPFTATLNYTLLNDSKGYSLSKLEWLWLPISSAYADRHFKAANEGPENLCWGHKIIAYAEKIPIIGAIVSLAERITVFVICCIFITDTDSPLLSSPLLSTKELIAKLDSRDHTNSPFEVNFNKLVLKNNSIFVSIPSNTTVIKWASKKTNIFYGTSQFVQGCGNCDPRILNNLIETLQRLQTEGLLDETFKCKDGVQLLLTADYVERIEVLQLLLTLRLENPTQVTLLGSSRYNVLNTMFTEIADCDPNFKNFINTGSNKAILHDLWGTFHKSCLIESPGE
jgi:hypothetical protein